MTVHPQVPISPSQLLTQAYCRSSLPPLADQILVQVLQDATGALRGTPVALVDSAVWRRSNGHGGIVASP